MEQLHPSVGRSKHLFHIGFLISFLASLPPGMTNVVTIQIATSGGYITAWWFAAGILLAEVTYARICSAMIARMFKFEFVVTVLQWLVLFILAAMAASSFFESTKGSIGATSHLPGKNLPPLISGFLLMMLNPVQIPFWLGWATILMEKKKLPPASFGKLQYLAGVGLGSLAASALFIIFGQIVYSFLDVNKSIMHFIFGCVFAMMALIQAARLFKTQRKDLKT